MLLSDNVMTIAIPEEKPDEVDETAGHRMSRKRKKRQQQIHQDFERIADILTVNSQRREDERKEMRLLKQKRHEEKMAVAHRMLDILSKALDK